MREGGARDVGEGSIGAVSTGEAAVEAGRLVIVERQERHMGGNVPGDCQWGECIIRGRIFT